MDIYTKLKNREYTLKEKIAEVVKLSQTLADKGASINDIGYSMLLKEALQHTDTTKEKELATRVEELLAELDSGIKSKRMIGFSPYGFQKRIETILTQQTSL
ncbi:MAG: hypothetical protein ABIH63_03205 [archaeon]